MLKHAEPAMKKTVRGEQMLETVNTEMHTNCNVLSHPTQEARKKL
jgi:hypothetical protein